MFKHALGSKVRSRLTGLEGTINARSENLYGCNRYAIQPRVDKDGRVPDAWWVDEDDIEIIGDGLASKIKKKLTGGPMSRKY